MIFRCRIEDSLVRRTTYEFALAAQISDVVGDLVLAGVDASLGMF